MERAFHLAHLKAVETVLRDRKFQRIYWGAEFCQNRIPTPAQTGKILKLCLRAGKGFTLITPFVTDSALEKLSDTFVLLKKVAPGCEIVVNDWGVLEFLNQRFNGVFRLALGRLLIRQPRDPAIQQVIKKHPPSLLKNKEGEVFIIVYRKPSKEFFSWIRSSYAHPSVTQRFLSENNIFRIELNNPIQGVDFSKIFMAKSIYIPLVNISTTRFCPMDTDHQKIYRIGSCKKECLKYYDRLEIDKNVIYKIGNTIFYKNPLKSNQLKEADVDRIVYQSRFSF